MRAHIRLLSTGRVLTRLLGVVLATLVGVCAAGAMLPGPRAEGADVAASAGRTLTVVVAFADHGLADGERLCLSLYAGSDAEFVHPLQIKCLAPGDLGVTFAGLDPATYRIALPSTGTFLFSQRYQGEIVSTEIPAQAPVKDFVVQVQLDLLPRSGPQVEVRAYVCPAGTDGGKDAARWATACPDPANGITFALGPLTTTPEAATLHVVTGDGPSGAGSALLSPRAPGRYKLAETRPSNVASPIVWFVASEADGFVAHPSDGTLQVGADEYVLVSAYNVLAPSATAAAGTSPTPGVGGTAPPSVATPGPFLIRQLPDAGSGRVVAGWPAIALLVALAGMPAAAVGLGRSRFRLRTGRRRRPSAGSR